MEAALVVERSSQPLLRVERLSAGFEARVVLRRISFEVPRHGATMLLGPGGVGKSMLLRTLGRWNEPRPSFWVHGRAWLGNEELLHGLPREEARKRVAMLAQKARLFTATILENAISDVAHGQQLTFGEKRDLAREVLEPWGLWQELRDVLDERVTSLTIARQRMLSLARLLSGGAQSLLLDEPLRDVHEYERRDLVDLLTRIKERCALVMVTHDQGVARTLGDAVCLLTAGELVETGPAAEFFRAPQTELGQEFLRSGNCWPKPPASETIQVQVPSADRAGSSDKPSWAPTPEERAVRPGGFHWIVPGLLGGMQWPGLLCSEHTDLAGLRALGVCHLVSLTETPFDPAKLARYGITGRHFPIEDMGVPDPESAIAICRRISDWVDAGRPVVLHCKAGLGRTGTMLACTLISRGVPPVQAIQEVRLVNPLYIQSEQQLEFIGKFGDFCRR